MSATSHDGLGDFAEVDDYGTDPAYPVMEIADDRAVRFPGFDALTPDYPQLPAVIREHRYAVWRTALSSVIGVFLITDARDGRNNVGKAPAPRESFRDGRRTRPTVMAATWSSAT